MLKLLIVLGVIWTGIAATMWLTLVPATISGTTFGWLNADSLTMLARPSRSIRWTSPDW